MTQYRHYLPQLSNDLFLTDGGIETTLIFREGLDLPDFAAFETKLGYTNADLAELNRRAIALLHNLRQEYETEQSRMVISGCVGPRSLVAPSSLPI